MFLSCFDLFLYVGGVGGDDGDGSDGGDGRIT